MRTPHLPSQGTVIACIALFVSLGGAGAYAAGMIGPKDIQKDAVRSKHIKDGKVKRVDLGSDALDGTGVLTSRFYVPTDSNTLPFAYGPVSGMAGQDATTDSDAFKMISPDQDLVARDMKAYFDKVTINSARRLVLEVNNSATDLQCTASGGRRKGVPAGTQETCSPPAGTEVAIPGGSQLVWKTDTAGDETIAFQTYISASVILAED
jgi:hypothetical protein